MRGELLSRISLGVFLLLLAFPVFAQNPGLSFKRLFLDYQTLQGGDFGAFQDYGDGFEIGYHHPLTNNLSLNVPLKVGLITKGEEIRRQHILGMDVQLHLAFLKNPDRFRPYVLAGAGGVWQAKDSFNLQVPVGLGVDIRLAENAYLNLQSEFRWSSATDNNNFNHGIGFKYLFGQKEEMDMPDLAVDEPAPVDTDGDGIADPYDACPTIAGLAAFAGCPDTDGDGVQDNRDECPDIVGLIEFNGCPDSDADGVSDKDDECPTVPGTLANKGCPEMEAKDSDGDGINDDNDLCPDKPGLAAFRGCPDTDGDGIEDMQDKCPDKAGLPEFKGCPDTDGDGIEDSKDRCPNTAGPASNNGCPVIESSDREVLSFAMRAVQFELGKATLKPESYSILNQITGILQKYPDYNLSIEGHTDNTGAADTNQKLSESRAKSCYDYLVQKGISAKRLTYKGFGQTRPIADNSTYSGRTLNRRVEFNMVPVN